VLYPYVAHPDILIVMSQEACTRFVPELKPGGLLLVEEDLVRLAEVPGGIRVYGVPATRLAEELGKRMVLNIVMVGFFAAIAGVLTSDALRAAVADSVPPSFKELNLRAFDKGYAYGIEHRDACKANGEAELVGAPHEGD
jgi:2-oxoglutarate ferredoxin oxidoreductase subunit gamma